MSDYVLWRKLTAKYACINLYSHLYGEGQFTLSDTNIDRMAELLQVPDDVFQEMEKACYEDVKYERLPAIPRYKGEYHQIYGYQVGWDFKDSTVKKFSTPHPLPASDKLTSVSDESRFAVAGHLYIQSLADQFWQQTLSKNEVEAVLSYVGMPPDKTAGMKLSKNQKDALKRILAAAESHFIPSTTAPMIPHLAVLEWHGAVFAPELDDPNASRLLRQLAKRGLLELLNKTKSNRVSHIRLTPTGAAIARRLSETN